MTEAYAMPAVTTATAYKYVSFCVLQLDATSAGTAR